MPKRTRRTKREHKEFIDELRHEKGLWAVEHDPLLGELVDALTEEGVEVGIAEAIVAEAHNRGVKALAQKQAAAVQTGLTKLYDSVFGGKKRRSGR